MPRLSYPASPAADVVDDYHGVRVADPYRWLEDAGDSRTQAWVAAQNALTRAELQGPARRRLVERLTRLYDYPRTGVPFRRGGRYFFSHNTGLQDQPVLYVQDGPAGTPRVLIDPNTLSAAGPVALTAVAPDEDGGRLAYALSESGSDRQTLFVRDVGSGRDLGDRLEWVKFVSVAWVRSGEGFFYTRFPAPGTVAPGDEHYFNRVYFHRLGAAQADDVLIFEKPDERETVFGVEVSDDDRWVVLTAYRGSSDRSEVHVIDRRAAPQTP
ncbi:MAG: S9 family peptidase, partial [Acidobacteriota bacterium]